MNKIDLGRALGIVANIGVIAGILLLAYELSQNRGMTRAQTRNAIAQTLIDLQINEANSPELVEILLKVDAGEPITAVERYRYERTRTALFRYWENVHYQYRNGLYDDDEYITQREAWRDVLSDAPVRELWCGRRDRQSRQFVVEIDSLLGDAQCE